MSQTNIDLIITSHQCQDWMDRCLDSVRSQDAQPRHVLVCDDATEDEEYIKHLVTLCSAANITLQLNHVNVRKGKNLWDLIPTMDADPDTVIMTLDGDDFLPPGSLKRLNEVYQDPSIWLTYGNYQPYPRNTGQSLAREYPAEVVANRSFREFRNAYFNHPLTWRRFLWDALEEADFKDTHGQWFMGGADLVIIMPLLELAAPEHFRFLDETLYMYNAVNPWSEVDAGHIISVEESRAILDRPKKPRYDDWLRSRRP